MRQQHQCHRRAVLTIVRVVLPQRTAAAVVLANLIHLRDHGVVFGKLGSGFVAAPVIASPSVGDGTACVGSLLERAPRVHARCGGFCRSFRDVNPAIERQGLVHEPEHCQAAEPNRTGREGTLERVQLIARQPLASAVEDPRNQLQRADHHEHVAQQIDERQQTWVPQQADAREAVAGDIHQSNEHQSDQSERSSGQVPAHDHCHESNNRQAGDQEIKCSREREEHVPERVRRATRAEAVLHVGHKLVAKQERADPPGRQQQRGDTATHGVPATFGVDPGQGQDNRADGDEDQNDAVRHGCKRQHRCCPHASAASPESVCEQSEPEHCQRESDRERVLTSHCRLDVAAVDLKALVKQKAETGESEQLGDRLTELGKSTEGPAGQREQEQPRRCHDLEGDAVGDEWHCVEEHDCQGRNNHVEAVQREAAVPVHAPAAELEVGKEVVAKKRRGPDMSTHIAACGRRVIEQEVATWRKRVEMNDQHHDDRRGHQRCRGDQHPSNSLIGPLPIPPCNRTTQHTPGHTLSKRVTERDRERVTRTSDCVVSDHDVAVGVFPSSRPSVKPARGLVGVVVARTGGGRLYFISHTTHTIVTKRTRLTASLLNCS